MKSLPLPEAPRRGEAVRMACASLLACGVRMLPPDPFALAGDLRIFLLRMSVLEAADPETFCAVLPQAAGQEAFTAFLRGGFPDYFIFYNDAVRSPERIRFSIFHEFGHIQMRHFEAGDLKDISTGQYQVLEEEANIFARNFLCPPPIVDLIRGDPRDPKWAALFCVSEAAWQVRLRTLDADRKFIDRHTADLVRLQFLDYMFGRRCRECGMVFTDQARLGRCPGCGSRFLLWNPGLETREEALRRRHVTGAVAEDLKPRLAEEQDPDLTAYWKMLRNSASPFKKM